MNYRFSIARLPRIVFGGGVFKQLPDLVSRNSHCVLVVVGARSFTQTPQWQWLQRQFTESRIGWDLCRVTDEPSPEQIDTIVKTYRNEGIGVVLGIGGGSVMDAAKAIAGLLMVDNSVMDFLEGVGRGLEYQGPSVPFIAVPTTAGTGSEATQNAVLSVRGEGGFKKSFRHERLVAHYAVVDPDLMADCPPSLIAANGMDALTQLIESYVSTRAGAFTDGLVEGGLRAVRGGLLAWYEEGGPAAREKMAFAALVSGIALAQTGLGSVHGLASPLGGFFPIPHGVVCGTLLAPATRVNIEAMINREPDNRGLEKYAGVAELLCNRRWEDRQQAREALVELLQDWMQRLKLPRLADYGISEHDLPRVAAHSRGGSMKTNPIILSDDELVGIMRQRL
ncbi:MAG: iron-containing alcohol dehydrogenase [Gammaproteobacteria bacterium]|nr:iron-containing alcohol dehydrogenase [Gammaproteobacteria bacterium]